MTKMASKHASVAGRIQQPTVDLLARRHRRKMKRLKNRHNITDERRKETVCRCPRQSQPIPSEYSSQIETGSAGPSREQQHEKPEWFDCFAHGCQKQSCFERLDVLPIKYPRPSRPCVQRYVQPRSPADRNRRPQLPEAPEMLSNLKQGIRHPFQVTQRRKEMQTQLDKLTDEHQAFAFPSGTKAFVDDAYYSINSVSSLVENYDIVCRDIHMQKISECTIRPSLLAVNRDKYKFFRDRLPMPQKRVLDIPGNRTLHWHNWVIRPLRTTYSNSWREDIKVPDNWFGPKLNCIY